MREVGSAEWLTVAKSAGHVFYLLNFGIDGFADGVDGFADDVGDVGDVEKDRVYYSSEMFFNHPSDVLDVISLAAVPRSRSVMTDTHSCRFWNDVSSIATCATGFA